MLMPKRVKRRKQFRGSMKGKALRGNTISYGDFGLVAVSYTHLAYFYAADKIKLISDGSRRIRRAAASVLWKKDRGRKS